MKKLSHYVKCFEKKRGYRKNVNENKYMPFLSKNGNKIL